MANLCTVVLVGGMLLHLLGLLPCLRGRLLSNNTQTKTLSGYQVSLVLVHKGGDRVLTLVEIDIKPGCCRHG